ncbi:MAG: hypothetical protein ACYC5M_19000 [Anaerolineae bacterium]
MSSENGGFWKQAWFREVLRQVVIALLVALLAVLGYDAKVVQPQMEATRALLQSEAAAR